MNIGFPIDWAITGQMIGGIGTISGAIAVAFVGWFGARQWRRQKVQALQMDVAMELLRLVYEVEDDLIFVARNILLSDEISTIEQHGYSDPYSRQKLTDLDGVLIFVVIQKRFERIKANVQNLRGKLVEARLVLGSGARDRIFKLYDYALELQAVAVMGLEERSDPEKVTLYLRRLFTEDGQAGTLITELAGIVEEIETELATHTAAGK